jgi:hypothetical protein
VKAVACRKLVLLAAAVSLTLCAGCGPRMDLGSNVLWVSLFETGNFHEWTDVGGLADAYPSPPNTIQVSTDYHHHGRHAAELTITAGPDGTQENAGLVRRTGLPQEAYYSAWYYLPRTITVGTFWIIFKFRQRMAADDPMSDTELFDLKLANADDGALVLALYDHRIDMDLPLPGPAPVVPVSTWFQIEAFYRNTNDTTGRLTFWLNGKAFLDLDGQPMAPNPWVEWDVVNVGENLTPSTAIVAVDDCAVSLSRVGTTGLIIE